MPNVASRKYWENYIESIIDSIREDKDTIIDMLLYGELQSATIKMPLLANRVPIYQFEVNKITKKSPFGEDEE